MKQGKSFGPRTAGNDSRLAGGEMGFFPGNGPVAVGEGPFDEKVVGISGQIQHTVHVGRRPGSIDDIGDFHAGGDPGDLSA